MTEKKTYVKDGKNWTLTNIETDEGLVFKDLAEDLTYRYIIGSKSIKQIKYINNFDGTRTFKVYHSNDTKTVYTVSK